MEKPAQLINGSPASTLLTDNTRPKVRYIRHAPTPGICIRCEEPTAHPCQYPCCDGQCQTCCSDCSACLNLHHLNQYELKPTSNDHSPEVTVEAAPDPPAPPPIAGFDFDFTSPGDAAEDGHTAADPEGSIDPSGEVPASEPATSPVLPIGGTEPQPEDLPNKRQRRSRATLPRIICGACKTRIGICKLPLRRTRG